MSAEEEAVVGRVSIQWRDGLNGKGKEKSEQKWININTLQMMTHKPLTKKGSYIFVPLGGTLELPNHFKEHRECRQCMEAGISECLAILTLTSFPLSPALHSSLSQRS